MVLTMIIDSWYFWPNYNYTQKNSSRNFTQLLSKVGTHGQVGDYLILL